MASKARLVTLMPIRDMSRALKFYTKKLGAKMGDRGRGAMKNDWASVRFGTDEIWLIRPSSFEKRKLAYSTLLVRNIKSYVKQLTARGVKFQRPERMGPSTRIEGPIAFESFGASAFLKDPEGNLLMVWENFPPM
ncbi:MAG TPA: VOC family protein [Thermoplasmata archaeon]|nr:VOC family protein [Thermoplasmata archaeon]